jgi:hypothetical protein
LQKERSIAAKAVEAQWKNYLRGVMNLPKYATWSNNGIAKDVAEKRQGFSTGRENFEIPKSDGSSKTRSIAFKSLS